MERSTPTRQWTAPQSSQQVELKQSGFTEDDVRRRAYEHYRERGPNAGNEVWEWLLAERELQANNRRSAYLKRP